MLTPLEGGVGDYLQLSLDQAVAALRGLGGMVHLGSSYLYLAAAAELPVPVAQAWEEIGRDEAVPPARAVQDGTLAWMPAARQSKPGTGRRHLPPGTALVSVPVPAPGGPMGTLSVLTRARREPDAEEQALLDVLAQQVADLLRKPRPVPSEAGTGWQHDSSFPGVYEGAETGAFEWDATDRTVVWDEPALRILGVDPESFDGRITTWKRLIHPEDLPYVLACTHEAIRTHTACSVEYRIRQSDESLRWVEARGHVPLTGDGTPPRLIGTLRDITDARLAQDSASNALRHMSDMFLAVDSRWRITFLNRAAERLFGSSQELLGHVPWEVIPGLRGLDMEDACRHATADGRPVSFDARWPTDQRWLHIQLIPVPTGLTVCVTDITSVRWQEAEQAAAEGAAAERTARIAELTRALTTAITGRNVVDLVNEHMVSLFGAVRSGIWVQERGRVFELGSIGYSQEFLDRFEGIRLEETPPTAQAMIDRIPIFIASPEEFTYRYPELAFVPAVSDEKAWAFLPLIASGRTIGCSVIAYNRPHTFTDDERTLLTALSGLVAQALERARLYDAEHRQAQELQRGLLPRTLPSLPAVTTAARYLPAGEGAEVGGDWYDVIPLSADRVALVIGDVMGHGLSEAATMGRLRTAVRTLADLEQPPDELFFHLNSLISDLGDDFYATCLYALYDPTTRLCTIATAGHPPPAVIHRDGTAHFPDLPHNPPLGAAALPYDTAVLEVPEDSLLVLYTDGLVESATCDMDQGMIRLAQHFDTVQGSVTADLDDLCDSLLSTLLPDRRRTGDDAALLIARTHASAPQDIACWQLPEDPKAAGQARGHIQDQLTAWGLEELVMTTELLASELVGNVVRHAKGPITLRLLRSRTLICEVTDHSLTMPRIRHAADTDEGGRGLQLIAALTDRWGARYTGSGKSIWTEQALPAGTSTGPEAAPRQGNESICAGGKVVGRDFGLA